jgi:hypothetical protein
MMQFSKIGAFIGILAKLNCNFSKKSGFFVNNAIYRAADCIKSPANKSSVYITSTADHFPDSNLPERILEGIVC